VLGHSRRKRARLGSATARVLATVSSPTVEPISSPLWVQRACRVAQCLGPDAPVKPRELLRVVRAELQCAPIVAKNALAVAEWIGLVQFSANGWLAVE
jgi:hypothetical protein